MTSPNSPGLKSDEAAEGLRQTPLGDLWVPGDHLDTEFPTPSGEDLVNLWNEHMGTNNAVQTQEVFGVFTPPNRAINAVASIDLCEVLRCTQDALYEITGVKADHNSNYSTGTWYDPKKVGKQYERSIVVSAIRIALSKGYVQPVDRIDSIATILDQWRKAGVWVIANTSTLPGCEPATIEHTLAKSAKQQFDGIVFPRNHDGNGSMSKANALHIIMREAGVKPETPIIHIDDADYHHEAFQDEEDSFHGPIFLLAPAYNGKPVPHAHATFDTPLAAFTGASYLLNKLGVSR